MKKKTSLYIDFAKFVVEKYNKEDQEIPQEETEKTKKSNAKLVDNIDDILNPDNDNSTSNEDEQNEDENIDDENIDDLLKEYKKLEKNYWRLKNDKIYKRR